MAAFDPSLLGPEKISAWWDPSDPAAVTLVSGYISGLVDKSENGNGITQGSSSGRPLLFTNGINGLDCIKFENSAQKLPFLPPDPINTIFYVQNSSDNKYILLGSDSPSCYILAVENSTSGSLDNFGLSPSNYVIDGQYKNLSTRAQFYTDLNNRTALVSVEGLGWSVINPNPMYFNGYAALDSSWNFDGLLGEIILFKGIPTDAERQAIEGYLAHKWGFQSNLPDTHPYKNDPPQQYFIKGYVKDKFGQKAPNRRVVIIDEATFEVVGDLITDDVGYFQKPFLENTGTYTVIITGEPDRAPLVFDKITPTP